MPLLQTFEIDTSTDRILEAVEKDGAVILSGAMSESQLTQVAAELGPYIDATPNGDPSFTGSLTTRTGALIARSEGCQQLTSDSRVLSAVETFLAPFCERIQLHLTQVIRLRPEQGAQPLHRDRQAWGLFLPKEIEPQLNTIWALTDFSIENGATRVVPGSHKWGWDRKAKPEEIAQAVMSKGSVLIYSGSVIHSGGKNNATSDRIGINITYALGWLRQEENQYLSCPPHIAKDLPAALQELLGYTMGSVACGYFTEPLAAGQGKEICAPEYALGRKPRASQISSIVERD